MKFIDLLKDLKRIQKKDSVPFSNLKKIFIESRKYLCQKIGTSNEFAINCLLNCYLKVSSIHNNIHKHIMKIVAFDSPFT